MGATSVRDVCVHATDETGTPITAVYAKNPPWYAIYRTRD
ncbi:MAG: hypothetical protein JWP04_3398, partial [Belnapia sp.]|nr:hypothetical protein [Belnapia sp.]